METIRTVKLKLHPTAEQSKLLQQTMETFINALNHISRLAITAGCPTSHIALHRLVYYEVREKFALPSQMTCTAIRQVTTAYKSMLSNGNKNHQAAFNFKGGIMLQGGIRGREFRVHPILKQISISTIGERQKIKFDCGKYQTQYFDWALGSATLIKRNNIFWLYVTFKTEVPQMPLDEAKTIIGVDLGMNYLATAIAPDGKTIFIEGGNTKHRKHHYRRTRQGLQSKGTKSAKRTLKHLSGREARFQANVNHITSKHLVSFAVQYENPVLVLEDLTGIQKRAKHRKKQRSDFHTWAFFQLRQFITYKAQAMGIPVVLIDPRNTSKTCSRCGSIGTRKKHNFACKCGFTDHSDRNAAKNIALRFVVHRQVYLDDDGVQSITP